MSRSLPITSGGVKMAVAIAFGLVFAYTYIIFLSLTQLYHAWRAHMYPQNFSEFPKETLYEYRLEECLIQQNPQEFDEMRRMVLKKLEGGKQYIYSHLPDDLRGDKLIFYSIAVKRLLTEKKVKLFRFHIRGEVFIKGV